MKANFLSTLVAVVLFHAGFVHAQANREFVNVVRAKSDADYAKRIVHHKYIKSYLQAPARNRPEFEALFSFLLQNGYGIQDLRKAWFALNVPLPRYNVERAASKGVSEEKMAQNQERLAIRNLVIRREIVMESTGVHDEAFVDAMMELVPPQATVVDDMPLFNEAPNEPLLTDADWMKPEHRESIAAYKGEPKKMWPKAPPAKDSTTSP